MSINFNTLEKMRTERVLRQAQEILGLPTQPANDNASGAGGPEGVVVVHERCLQEAVGAGEMTRRLRLVAAVVSAGAVSPLLWYAGGQLEGKTERVLVRTLAVGLALLNGYLLYQEMTRQK